MPPVNKIQSSALGIMCNEFAFNYELFRLGILNNKYCGSISMLIYYIYFLSGVNMTDYQNLSENELQSVIENAEKALKLKQSSKRKEVIAQIKELAASIDITVEIIENDKISVRKGVKVPIKYRHPDDNEKTWTGRGVTPKWMQALLNAGHDRSEFKVK